MKIAAEHLKGKGEGHNIAGGIQIPLSSLENFLELVNLLIINDLERLKRVES